VEEGDYRVWFSKSSSQDTIISSAEMKISGTWKAPLSAITVLADKSILSTGEASDLELSATMEDAVHLAAPDQPFYISSSDESVAVIVNGKIKAVGKGAAKITAELTINGVTKKDSIGICVI
jgi:uncharacterized protein YjdB